jgi:predicted SAM-dependent methyltransferase
MNFDKLNLGCGSNFVKGWLNIGLLRKRKFPRNVVKEKDGAFILNCNLTKKFPACVDVQYTYASHFIEHLAFQQAKRLLKKIYEVTQEGGVLRLTFPDLELWIKNYYENDTSFFLRYQSLYLGRELKTKGEIFMSQVHGFGHKWCYDFETMKHVLGNIGFVGIQKKLAFNSVIPDIDQLEPNNAGRLLETAYVECFKSS